MMIALPSQMMTLLREVPMAAWPPLTSILRYIASGDRATALARADELADRIPPFVPRPVAIATQPKAQ